MPALTWNILSWSPHPVRTQASYGLTEKQLVNGTWTWFEALPSG